MSIKTDVAVIDHESRIKALETLVRLLSDEVKMLRPAQENAPRETLRLKGRAA